MINIDPSDHPDLSQKERVALARKLAKDILRSDPQNATMLALALDHLAGKTKGHMTAIVALASIALADLTLELEREGAK